MSWSKACIAVLITASAALPAGAQDQTESLLTKEFADADSAIGHWHSSAPPPRSDEFDWMQFTNGEWLKGDIKDLQDDSFKFDSDELGTFSLDWDDIESVFSPRPNTVMLMDRTVLTGQIRVEGDDVTIIKPDGDRVTVKRDEVRSIIPGRQSEWNYWSGNLSFGTMARQGNNDQVDISASLFVQRRDLNSRFNFDYKGSFSAIDGETTTDTHRATTFYDWYFTPRFFWRTVQITAYRDQFQNIDYRLTPSSSLGYDLIDKDGFEWYVGGGLGWEYTKFFEPLAGSAEDQSQAAVILATNIMWEATPKIDVGFEFNITLPPQELRNYNSHTAFTTDIEVWGDFDLEFSIIWDRVNNPSQSADGTTPVKDDIRMFVGIGWEF